MHTSFCQQVLLIVNTTKYGSNGTQTEYLKKASNVDTYTQAQRIIPLDSLPLILAGFRLHKTTTDLSCIWSMGTSWARPLMICLGPVTSPTSTCDMYRLSASGCCQQPKEIKVQQLPVYRYIQHSLHTWPLPAVTLYFQLPNSDLPEHPREVSTVFGYVVANIPSFYKSTPRKKSRHGLKNCFQWFLPVQCQGWSTYGSVHCQLNGCPGVMPPLAWVRTNKLGSGLDRLSKCMIGGIYALHFQTPSSCHVAYFSFNQLQTSKLARNRLIETHRRHKDHLGSRPETEIRKNKKTFST